MCAWGVTVAHYNNSSVKTNMKREILISGNVVAPFYVTKMTSLHGTWTGVQFHKYCYIFLCYSEDIF
jgi:hypothetical protein